MYEVWLSNLDASHIWNDTPWFKLASIIIPLGWDLVFDNFKNSVPGIYILSGCQSWMFVVPFRTSSFRLQSRAFSAGNVPRGLMGPADLPTFTLEQSSKCIYIYLYIYIYWTLPRQTNSDHNREHKKKHHETFFATVSVRGMCPRYINIPVTWIRHEVGIWKLWIFSIAQASQQQSEHEAVRWLVQFFAPKRVVEKALLSAMAM